MGKTVNAIEEQFSIYFNGENVIFLKFLINSKLLALLVFW